jgi:hypothetical protein
MAPPLNLPQSDNVVTVSAIDTTTNMIAAAHGFVEPVIPGHESWNMHTFAFLVENKKRGKTILFDAGSRKDWWNHSPVVVKAIDRLIPGLEIKKNVDEI